MSDLKNLPKSIVITEALRDYPRELTSNADLIIRDGLVLKDRRGVATRDATPEEVAAAQVITPKTARMLVEGCDLGWKGEPPAEGTRRKLILDTIDRKMSGPANLHLEIADEIEEALIAYGADAEDRRDQLRYAVPASERRAADKPPNGSPRRERIFDVVLRHQARLTSSHGGCLTRGNALDLADQIDAELTGDDSTVAVLDVLDSLEIPWRRGEECLGLGERATILGDRYTEARRKLRSQEATIAGFAETIAAQAPFVGRTDEWVQGLVMAAITAGQESDVPFPADVVDSLLADFGIKPTLPRPTGSILIHTLEGDHRADPGDWIIRGVKGEFYPCKPDIFEATYELDGEAPEPEPMGV